jgi:hypothetical protein
MNVTRNGKIARLPRDIREHLNRRLQDGEQGKHLVEWLNELPQVRRVLAEEFGGKPLREQNISEWRKGGYRDWLAQQEALDMVKRVTADADELQPGATEPLTEKLAPWLVARYFVAAKTLLTENGRMDWKVLRELCNDVVALRRGDQNAEWLRLDRERLRVATQDGEMKWKKKIIIGLETLDRFVNKHHPKAKAAFEALAEQVREPLDKIEGAP